MATRHLYIARHGDADAFGELTDIGAEQARLLGRRLSTLPIDGVWHSPLPRAAASARQLNIHLSGAAPVSEALELIDHVPHVPAPGDTPAPWKPLFDGFDAEEAAAGGRLAARLVARFTAPIDHGDDRHEILITHAYQVAWLLRHVMAAPPVRWLGIPVANAALTVIEIRPEQPAGVIMVNEMSHLPPELRWTGFGTAWP